jgi:hypothetical protein
MESKEISMQDVIAFVALCAVGGLLGLIHSHWEDITYAVTVLFWVVVGGAVVIGIGWLIHSRGGISISIPITRLDRIERLHRKRDARIFQMTQGITDSHLTEAQLQLKAAIEVYYNTKIARLMETI